MRGSTLSTLLGSESQSQFALRVAHHVDAFVDDVVNLHARTVRRQLEPEDAANLVGRAQDPVEVRLGVRRRETVADPRRNDRGPVQNRKTPSSSLSIEARKKKEKGKR